MEFSKLKEFIEDANGPVIVVGTQPRVILKIGKKLLVERLPITVPIPKKILKQKDGRLQVTLPEVRFKDIIIVHPVLFPNFFNHARPALVVRVQDKSREKLDSFGIFKLKPSDMPTALLDVDIAENSGSYEVRGFFKNMFAFFINFKQMSNLKKMINDSRF